MKPTFWPEFGAVLSERSKPMRTVRHALPLLVCLAVPGLVAAGPPDARRLAERVDQVLAERWAKAGIEPAQRSDDAEFLRRASLDLTGKVPSVGVVRRFLADATPDKRRVLIERLLRDPAYASYFGTQWRHLLVPDADNDLGRQPAVEALDAWLLAQFAANVPYDRLTRDVLTWVPPTAPGADPANPSPRRFYLGREDKPEELAAAASRVFLGIRLECAQCHDHPFAHWKREQFWSQAAFFAGLRQPGVRKVVVPGTTDTRSARFLDGTSPPPGQEDVRAALANWITAPDNPYFARAVVNRLWASFFGIGLVDPVDDLGEENPPSHPELLDELARAFVASGYDVQFVIRVLTQTRAYQLSSVSPDGKPANPRLFGRMNVKGLTPEQLFDSLIEATALRGPQLARQRTRFLARFPRSESRLEGRTSIPQALALMNGELLAAAVDPAGDSTLGAVVASPFLQTPDKVETLFLAALGRPPKPEESRRFVSYVDSKSATGDQRQALADVFWALLNSPEFLFNH
jgi:hypothetical protein